MLAPLTAALAATLATLAQNGLDLLAGAVLSKGKQVVEEKLGVDIEELATTPEGVQKLRDLQVQHYKDLFEFTTSYNQQVVELELARLADVASARQLQAEAMGQDDVFTKRFPYYFASFWSTFTLVYFFAVTFLPIPAAGVRFADTILGFMLGTAVASIFTYLYGSNRASSLKDSTINTLASKP